MILICTDLSAIRRRYLPRQMSCCRYSIKLHRDSIVRRYLPRIGAANVAVEWQRDNSVWATLKVTDSRMDWRSLIYSRTRLMWIGKRSSEHSRIVRRGFFMFLRCISFTRFLFPESWEKSSFDYVPQAMLSREAASGTRINVGELF